MALAFKQKRGPAGSANIRVLRNSLVIVFENGDSYEVPKEGWEDLKSGKYSLGMTPLRDKLGWVSPPPLTTHLVRFKEFGNRVNEVPEPELKRGGDVRQNRNGGTYVTRDELRVKANLEVIEGEYEGMSIMFMFPYAFEPISGSPYADVVTTPKKMEKIELFFRSAGLDTRDPDFHIAYSGNVLPALEQMLLDAGGVFSVSLNADGFVDAMSPLPAGSFKKPKKSKPAAKKSPKKAPAKKTAKRK